MPLPCSILKVDWLKNELGFDHAFNYKTVPVQESLKIGAPDGVDCFFENVGNADSSAIIGAMNNFGRGAFLNDVRIGRGRGGSSKCIPSEVA